MKIRIFVEQTESACSADSHDVQGYIATGATHGEVEASIRDAIAFHLDGLRDDDASLPAPSSYAVSAEFEVAA